MRLRIVLLSNEGICFHKDLILESSHTSADFFGYELTPDVAEFLSKSATGISNICISHDASMMEIDITVIYPDLEDVVKKNMDKLTGKGK
jgi:hypothetical protein